MLPIWIDGARDLGGRPAHGKLFAQAMGADLDSGRWEAEISTVFRGQFTATLTRQEQRLDVPPSTVEFLSHAGILENISVKETLVDKMLDVNPEWVQAMIELVGEQAFADNADSSDERGVVYLEPDLEPFEADGHTPELQIDALSDADFDDELKKLLGE
ncbi:hypothetical protein GC425_00190 [Corynebacterium sp. zg254]|uniref:Uncharacterized protein n=1 Tax=Corynebacterium zhongnanshanii TaxID=2768834 RepID=A0ABQ6VIC5_9CORY|nr:MULTISPECIES: hypothetical protein [Corynebacterium]KAB3523548.1 hypothetical protein F8377_05440 [Corynebacterium zhongnanshanii]MCR5913294.1 hypothetical protein [Corynebacterium sp. zg254]